MQKEGKIMALLITLFLSVAFVIGLLLAKLVKKRENVESFSVALAFGSMLGVVALDILPEMIKETADLRRLISNLLFAVIGFGLLLLLDRFVPEHEGKEESKEGNLIHIGIMATLAIAIHNIVEGMSIYSVALSSISSGLLLSLGVALHNIPMGMLIYSTTRGEKKSKAIVTIIISSFSTFCGGIIMALLESRITENIVLSLTSVALGMVLYILLMELLPSVIHSENKKKSFLYGLIGLVIVFLGTLFE